MLDKIGKIRDELKELKENFSKIRERSETFQIDCSCVEKEINDIETAPSNRVTSHRVSLLKKFWNGKGPMQSQTQIIGKEDKREKVSEIKRRFWSDGNKFFSLKDPVGYWKLCRDFNLIISCFLEKKEEISGLIKRINEEKENVPKVSKRIDELGNEIKETETRLCEKTKEIEEILKEVKGTEKKEEFIFIIDKKEAIEREICCIKAKIQEMNNELGKKTELLGNAKEFLTLDEEELVKMSSMTECFQKEIQAIDFCFFDKSLFLQIVCKYIKEKFSTDMRCLENWVRSGKKAIVINYKTVYGCRVNHYSSNNLLGFSSRSKVLLQGLGKEIIPSADALWGNVSEYEAEISTLVYSASTGHYFSTDGRSDHAGFISKPFWIEKSDVVENVIKEYEKRFYFSYHLNLANDHYHPGDCCRANVKVRMRVF